MIRFGYVFLSERVLGVGVPAMLAVAMVVLPSCYWGVYVRFVGGGGGERDRIVGYGVEGDGDGGLYTEEEEEREGLFVDHLRNKDGGWSPTAAAVEDTAATATDNTTTPSSSATQIHRTPSHRSFRRPVDLARLAGCHPSGVLCEIISEEHPTEMARLPDSRGCTGRKDYDEYCGYRAV